MISRKMQIEIKKKMVEKDLNMERIAKEIGCSRTVVWRTINGWEKPYGRIRDYLCNLMNCTQEELITPDQAA